MKTLGLIVEYNPFHNGHLYHLEQSKKLSGADYTVCVMSGNFIQRGEPAIINKWARTKAALLSGIDLVIELPVVYAMSSAESFAFGAVKILDSLGIVDNICFGSETGSLPVLERIAEVLYNEPEAYKSLLKEQLDRGLSYPAAREKAVSEYFIDNKVCLSDISTIIGTSNNILGIEYLKALKKLSSKIMPLTIKRVSNTYDMEDITGTISSATAIRKSVFSHLYNRTEYRLHEVLPEASLRIIEEEISSGRGPVSAVDFESILLSIFRSMSKEDILKLPYITEGLENRIKAAAENCVTLEDMIENISTRRYTRTRIQRILFNTLTGITSLESENFYNNGGPQYIRVLGFNQKGREMLNRIKENAALSIITKAADFKYSENPLIRKMLEIEARSTDQYVLGYNNPQSRKAGQDFTQNVVRV